MSHVREVQIWGTPHTMPAPHVEVDPEFKPEVEATEWKESVVAEAIASSLAVNTASAPDLIW